MNVSSVLMPFARHNVTNRIVGIEQVQRGNSCNCRCLSCNTSVTARKANVNQWHFAHRTNDHGTNSDCKFSPVTAIALILREQLPSLRVFNLDEIDLTDVKWCIDTKVDGELFDAYGINAKNKTSIAVEIPFANGKPANLHNWSSLVDIVLKIDTHAMAGSLFSHVTSNRVYSPEQLFALLLSNWSLWVYRFDSSQCLPSETDQEPKVTKSSHTTINEQQSCTVCVSCGSNDGFYGKGLICADCVRKQVGPRFNNITDMVRYYRKAL